MNRRGQHPRERSFGLYVSGVMDTDEREAFEAHVAACSDCAAQLRREAELEAMLYQVAQMQTPPAPPSVAALPRAERWGRAACGALATAAAVLLTLHHPTNCVEIGTVHATVAMSSTSPESTPSEDEQCEAEDGPACDMDSMMALATFPPEGSETEPAGACWLDEHGIDPLCVSSDPAFL